jgi:hypothetical protein
MDALFGLIGFVLAFAAGLLVMVFGWGLEVQSWGWVLGGNFVMICIMAVFNS